MNRRKTQRGFVQGEGEDGLEATQARDAITFICTSHSRDGVRLGVSRRLAGSKMFLVDVDVDVDTRKGYLLWSTDGTCIQLTTLAVWNPVAQTKVKR